MYNICYGLFIIAYKISRYTYRIDVILPLSDDIPVNVYLLISIYHNHIDQCQIKGVNEENNNNNQMPMQPQPLTEIQAQIE